MQYFIFEGPNAFHKITEKFKFEKISEGHLVHPLVKAQKFLKMPLMGLFTQTCSSRIPLFI